MDKSTIHRSSIWHGCFWVKCLFQKLGILATLACLLPQSVQTNGSHPSLSIVKNHVIEEGQRFSHLAVDRTTGAVYAGGVNHLYHFDSDLKILNHVETGPVYDDSLNCPATGCRDGSYTEITDNVNKVLLIDNFRSNLIVCGSVNQGSCQVRELRNISNILHRISEPIAANDDIASTVAFIAPGPVRPTNSDVLYIGVTYTGKSVYRDEVPAIATRSLKDDNLLDIAVKDVTTSTRMFINSLARERYPITYVYGFSSENFSYFLTRQAKSTHTGAPFISKLVRVCQNDPAYFSYTEIPIECTVTSGGSVHHNLAQAAYVSKPGADLAKQLGIQTDDDVLFVVFSPSEDNEWTAIPADESALCVYSMKSIRRMFIQNIQDCFRGRGDRGLDFISPSHKCIETRINDLNEDFCGMDVNTPLGGELPVESIASLHFRVRLTAIAVVPDDDTTTVFLGTEHGYLKKVVIENQQKANDDSEIMIGENSAVGQDMFFDKDKDYLYVTTGNKISKVRVGKCSMFDDCAQCLAAHDPSCGWCTMSNKCSTQRDCKKVDQELQYWVSHEAGQCTSITQVMPQNLQRTTARTLKLEIENLPEVEGSFQCEFSAIGKTLITHAKRTSQGVYCTTPRNDLLPNIPDNEHHFDAYLSVSMSQDQYNPFSSASLSRGTELAGTNFTFFDCNSYRTCTECVSSPFPCDWCVDGHRCTHDTAENCRNDILVTGVNRIGPSIRSGPSYCPRIAPYDEKTEILVPSGTEKAIKVKVDQVAQFIVQTRFVCQFNIEGRFTSVNAQLLSDTIYCDSMEFAYTTEAPSINATVAVIWGGSKPLDNPDGITVVMYKCHLMANNCRMCSNLPEHFGCGWCQSNGKCQEEDQCLDRTSWNQSCPSNTISDLNTGNSGNESNGSCSGLTDLCGEVASLKMVIQEMKEALQELQQRVNSNQQMLNKLT